MTGQCAVFDFRANRDYYTKDDLIKWCQANCKKWAFQLEEGDEIKPGEEHGYIHWQGRISLMKKRQRHIVLKMFTINGKQPNYLEPTSEKASQGPFFYVMKEDTRLEGPYTDAYGSSDNTFIPAHLKNIKLYQWQQYIIDSKQQRNSRKINLIYDVQGNIGKSTVASIGELIHGGIDVPPLNDFKELVALLCNICMDQNIRDPGLIFIDMPRAQRKDQLYGLYSAIEQIKKGKLYDCRHHYKCWWIESPQVWVFSNTLPDLNFLSIDRWNIWTVQNNELKTYDFLNDCPVSDLDFIPEIDHTIKEHYTVNLAH